MNTFKLLSCGCLISLLGCAGSDSAAKPKVNAGDVRANSSKAYSELEGQMNDPDPVRVHGAFLSDEEAERLADACSDQNVLYPQVESFDVSGGEEGDDEGGASMKNEKLDKLLFEVAQWAISVNGLSTSAVQRHFSVGYSRAGKIVDQLYGLGVCGPSKGNSKPRAMLVDMDQLMQLERSGRFG